MPKTGGCQCGTIRYEITGEPLMLAACHCTECQRQTGSAFGMSLVVREDTFRVTHGEPKTFTRASDSGRPLVCAFCPDCGTRIYHLPAYREGIRNIRAGTLDDTKDLQPAIHVWTRSKQAWVEIPEGAPQFDEQPPTS